jgi:hypothetical protein
VDFPEIAAEEVQRLDRSPQDSGMLPAKFSAWLLTVAAIGVSSTHSDLSWRRGPVLVLNVLVRLRGATLSHNTGLECIMG